MRKTILVLLMLICAFFARAQNDIVLQMLANFNSDSLLTNVKQLSGILPFNGIDTIKTRRSNTKGNEITFQYLKGKVSQWGLQVDTQLIFLTPQGKNLIATKQGLNSSKYIVIGAHYDNVGLTNPNIFYPGADDNASGVAAVLEAARLISAYNWPFTVKFAFWDDEEVGLKGSAAYSQTISSDNNFIGYVNFDMIAWDGNNDSVFEIHTKPIANSIRLGEKVAQIVNDYSIPLKHTTLQPGATSTDHQSFWLNGLTAVAINEEYTRDFNPHWHLPTDSISKFNIPYFINVSKLVAAIAGDLAVNGKNILSNNSIVQKSVSVYPNPAKDFLFVHCGLLTLQARILDIYGRILHQTLLDENNNSINLMMFEKGVYSLILETNGQSSVHKIIIN